MCAILATFHLNEQVVSFIILFYSVFISFFWGGVGGLVSSFLPGNLLKGNCPVVP